MSPEERSFEKLGVTRQFINAMDDMGYGAPTDIQWIALPRLKSGQDLIGVAQTGTGKTAAFAIPVIHKIQIAKKTKLALGYGWDSKKQPFSVHLAIPATDNGGETACNQAENGPPAANTSTSHWTARRRRAKDA